MSVYVRIRVAAKLAEVWDKTQRPELHQRWDLRFTGIEYLPKPEGEPQRFRYSTKLGFGLRVEGLGESIAVRTTETSAVSSLKFWSDDRKSLILEGSGYWKYTEDCGETVFETGYDYRTRYGAFGKVFDRLVFKPYIGWATAWSFDSLRLWIEHGVEPLAARRRALVHLVYRGTIGLVWIYQGLVPKLLFPQEGEWKIVGAVHPPLLSVEGWVSLIGVLEIAFGLAILCLFRARWLLGLQALVLIGLSVAALAVSPTVAKQPFNPVTLSLSLLALTAVSSLSNYDLPSARNCSRRKAQA